MPSPFHPPLARHLKRAATIMTLAATTRKLGLDFAAYLTDRFTRAGQIPSLADLITARAAQATGSPA